MNLISILNTKQINDGIFLNKAGENFNLEKIFLKVRVRLRMIYPKLPTPIGMLGLVNLAYLPPACILKEK